MKEYFLHNWKLVLLIFIIFPAEIRSYTEKDFDEDGNEIGHTKTTRIRSVMDLILDCVFAVIAKFKK